MTSRKPSRGKARRPKSKRATAKPRKPVRSKSADPTRPRREAADKVRAKASQASAVLHATDTDFDTIVAASPTPVLVDLWAPWCGPCRALAPNLEQVATTLAGEIRVIKVNVDENPGLSERFSVRSIPLLVFLRGEDRASLVGLQSAKDLEAWVRARLAGEPATEAPEEDGGGDSDEEIREALEGPPPSVEQVIETLRVVEGVTCEAQDGCVLIRIPGIPAPVALAVENLRGFQAVEDANGNRAVALLLNVEGEPREVVVARNEFAFAPDAAETGLEAVGELAVDEEDLPRLVGYTEMMRDLADAGPRLAQERDRDKCSRALVMLRYLINGARRMGVDCTAALAAWQKLREDFEQR